MIVVDTNVVVRTIVRDDDRQAQIAEDVLRGAAYLTLTVLIETEWVLRSRYGLPRSQLAAALFELMSFDTILVEREGTAFWALERYRLGADFADMIHIAAGEQAGSFATFDANIARRAGENTPVSVTVLDAS
ncbi:MAG: type II toxin-antitoxin system VapC family toxin [Pacificimonas sp.]